MPTEKKKPVISAAPVTNITLPLDYVRAANAIADKLAVIIRTQFIDGVTDAIRSLNDLEIQEEMLTEEQCAAMGIDFER
jgi:hypothetical protein